jgi:hypothetical protein
MVVKQNGLEPIPPSTGVVEIIWLTEFDVARLIDIDVVCSTQQQVVPSSGTGHVEQSFGFRTLLREQAAIGIFVDCRLLD